MGNVLTPNLNYTYNGIETTEVFIKPGVMHPSVTQLFDVIAGVRSKQQMGLVNQISGITLADDLSCGNETPSDGVEITNRTLETSPLKIRIDQCADVFANTIYENLLKTGVDLNDVTGTDVQRLMEEVIVPGIARDAFNIASFGDTGFTNPEINQLDGLWTRLIAGVADYCVQREGDFNDILQTDEALTTFKAMYESAPAILDQIPLNEKFFFVTRSVYDNLVSSYESVSNGSDLQVGYNIDGIPFVKYRGIEVVKLTQWDEAIKSFGLSDPNRAIYTTPSNHVLGFENTNDVTRLDIWYSQDDDLTKVRGRYKMGYNYKHCDLQVIAF